MRVAITGASGLVGGAVNAELRARGHEVFRLVRSEADAPDARRWDPRGGHVDPLTDVDAVVHLAGASVAKRWTDAQKERIRTSREEGTRTLVGALKRDGVGRLVSASAVGFYGDRGDTLLRESDGPGEGFLAEVCARWEAEAMRADAAVACVRIGIVLDGDEGALPQMAMPFKMGVGGRMGSGEQFLSWVHRADLASLFATLVERADVTGPVNGVAPVAIRQADFARAIAKVLRRPAWLPVPKFAMRAVMGEMADEMLLASQRVAPARAQGELEFVWRFGALPQALADCFRG